MSTRGNVRGRSTKFRNVMLSVLATTVLALGSPTAVCAQSPPPRWRAASTTRSAESRGPTTGCRRTIAASRSRRSGSAGCASASPTAKGCSRARSSWSASGGVSYDGRLASYYQNFETVPARKGIPAEEVTFVFRINDPIEDCDLYFRQPGGPLRSEVIKRR